MAVTVFGSPQSTRTQRVLIVLEALGLPYDFQHIDLAKGEHRTPEFLNSRHPFGKIPTIEINGLKLFESRAICRYLVCNYGGSLRLSSDPTILGLFEEAASIEYAYFEPIVSQLGWEKIFKKFAIEQDADTVAVARLEEELHGVLSYYDTLLSRRKWLAGEAFSLIDVFHIPWFNFLTTKLGYEEEVHTRRHLNVWWTNASHYYAWKKVSSSY